MPLVANKQVTAWRALCLHDTGHMCVSRAGWRGGTIRCPPESIGCNGRRLQLFIKLLRCEAAGRRTVGDYRLASGRKCQCLSAFAQMMVM